jgi:hypothetical protein
MVPATLPKTIRMKRANTGDAGLLLGFRDGVWPGHPSETLKVPGVLLTSRRSGVNM